MHALYLTYHNQYPWRMHGDVLGACVFDPDDTTSGVTTYNYRLDIVSRVAENIVRTDIVYTTRYPYRLQCHYCSSFFDGGGIEMLVLIHLWANIFLSPSLHA